MLIRFTIFNEPISLLILRIIWTMIWNKNKPINNINYSIDRLRSFEFKRWYSRVFSWTVERTMKHSLDLLEFLLPLLLYFDEFLFHEYFHLIFHLVNTCLKFQYFLLHPILPSVLIHGSIISLVLYHRQYLFLQFFNFPHHFLFSLVVYLSFLRN